MNPRRFAVAPMMRYSHRHGRLLWRLLCPPALLYTEMTVAAALARGAARTIEKALAHSPAERPLALQVAGADATELARAAAAGEGAGFCEINLNCGCPSERAGAGGFGACMMSRPALVAECVAAMKAAVSIPITVKCRLALIGADGRATGEVETLARAVFAAGCDGLIVHARAAVLGGLSPAQNRAAPPLDYDRVARLKRGWRDKAIWLNGGIGAAAAARRQLRFVDGVMAGRAATRDPLFLAETAAALAGDEVDRAAARRAAAAGFLPYLRRQIEAGEDPRRAASPLSGLARATAGAKKIRAQIAAADIDGLEKSFLGGGV